MNDLVARLRDWRSQQLTRLGGLFEEAAMEIERLRLQLRERGVTEPLPKEKRAEVSFRLSDEEREAIKLATDFLEDEFYGCSDKCAAEHNAVATLRKLLERLQ